MGRKAKIGKQRKDRFYKLAKETGYRSRASFKLIQLNRKFEFLQRSKVCIDLCSAPGGWLQVAQKFMPVSSVIIGIDLVPIKPIHNVMTFQCDITSSKCRSLLSKELKTWKADVVLNDGAPNVGKSWTHDAYSQIRLTLSAIHLASQFLIRGGWFVTKVFRSKDYNALMWLLSKLFKKVHATKPQASRHESAEIFVVCEKYLAPDHIDPKFFDPTFLFEDVTAPESEKKKRAELLKPDAKKKRPKAEGYADGDYTLYHKLNASEFIRSSKHIELLSDSNEIIIDNDDIKNDLSTSDEIKEYCKDLKVLSRKELLELISWRRKLRKKLYPKEKDEPTIETEQLELDNKDPEEDAQDGNEEDDEELATLKRKKKKVLKERRKLNERMSLKMITDNELREEHDMELFQLKSLKSRSEVDRFQDITMEDIKRGLLNVSDEEDDISTKRVYYERDAKDDYDFEDEGEDPSEKDAEDDENLDDVDDILLNEDNEDKDDDENGLLLDLDDRPKSEKSSIFFERQSFADEEFHDIIDKKLIEQEESKRKSNLIKKKVRFADLEAEDESIDEDEDSEEDEMKEKQPKDPLLLEKCKKNVKLDPESLALGSVMIQSKKRRRDIEEMAWNRYTHADQEFLPSWFKKDEDVHFYKPAPVPASTIKEYKEKLKEINARPIKKVAEAKARNKKKALRKLERARKKAEALTDAPDMSEKEKMATIRSLYNKALKNKKKDITYVVAKKGRINSKPGGVKGRYKLVDARMKKDKFKQKQKMKNSRKFHKKPAKEASKASSKPSKKFGKSSTKKSPRRRSGRPKK